MSEVAGVKHANYKIVFTGYENKEKKTQVLELVDESDLENFFKAKEETNNPVYAKMKVDGTPTWYIWTLAD